MYDFLQSIVWISTIIVFPNEPNKCNKAKRNTDEWILMVEIKLSKNQRCVRSIALAVMDASALEDLGIILNQEGLDSKLEKNLKNSIITSGERLRRNLKDFDRNCSLSPEVKDRYEKGKRILENSLDNLAFGDIYRAGSEINDAIQDTVASGEAVSC